VSVTSALAQAAKRPRYRKRSARVAASPKCCAYAQAMAAGEAAINQCPPGGAEGISRLADLTGRPPLPLNPDHGTEARANSP